MMYEMISFWLISMQSLLVFVYTSPEDIDWCSLNCTIDNKEYANTVCDTKCEINSEVLTQELKNIVLKHHNEFRNKIALGLDSRVPEEQRKASNMMLLTYDKNVERTMECWLKQCQYEHDGCRRTPEFENVGQNMAVSTYGFCDEEMILERVESWHEKEINLTQASVYGHFSMEQDHGHYTQLIWAETTTIGCAASEHINENDSKTCLFGCNYGTQGNILGSPVYKVGEPASACPKNSEPDLKYKGLCTLNVSGKTNDPNLSTDESSQSQTEETLRVTNSTQTVKVSKKKTESAKEFDNAIEESTVSDEENRTETSTPHVTHTHGPISKTDYQEHPTASRYSNNASTDSKQTDHDMLNETKHRHHDTSIKPKQERLNKNRLTSERYPSSESNLDVYQKAARESETLSDYEDYENYKLISTRFSKKHTFMFKRTTDFAMEPGSFGKRTTRRNNHLEIGLEPSLHIPKPRNIIYLQSDHAEISRYGDNGNIVIHNNEENVEKPREEYFEHEHDYEHEHEQPSNDDETDYDNGQDIKIHVIENDSSDQNNDDDDDDSKPRDVDVDVDVYFEMSDSQPEETTEPNDVVYPEESANIDEEYSEETHDDEENIEKHHEHHTTESIAAVAPWFDVYRPGVYLIPPPPILHKKNATYDRPNIFELFRSRGGRVDDLVAQNLSRYKQEQIYIKGANRRN